MRHLAWLLVVLAAGCPKSSVPVPLVGAVSARLVRSAPAELPQPADVELVRLVTEAAAAASGPSTYRPPKPSAAPGLAAKAKIELTWDPPPASLLRAEVAVRLEPRDDQDPLLTPIERAARVEKEAQAKLPTEPEVRAHLQRAFQLTVTSAVASEQLWLGPSAAVRQALTGTDLDLRDDAIRFCGERKDREAVPALISLLKSEDPELRDRAVGALAEIGDPRAVRPIGELAKFNDLQELPKIIDAISRVGGPEASSYLELLAESHPVPDVRQFAARALERQHTAEKLRADMR